MGGLRVREGGFACCPLVGAECAMQDTADDCLPCKWLVVRWPAWWRPCTTFAHLLPPPSNAQTTVLLLSPLQEPCLASRPSSAGEAWGQPTASSAPAAAQVSSDSRPPTLVQRDGLWRFVQRHGPTHAVCKQHAPPHGVMNHILFTLMQAPSCCWACSSPALMWTGARASCAWQVPAVLCMLCTLCLLCVLAACRMVLQTAAAQCPHPTPICSADPASASRVCVPLCRG